MTAKNEPIRLSIITVNYNRCADLEATLASVTKQAYKEFEYIVIDGGSEDGSLELIRKNEDIIDRWISEKDKGIFDAMNKGILLARGEYLLFLNGGDTLLGENALEEAMSWLERGDEDIVYGNILVEMPYGGNLVFRYPDKLSFRYFLERDLPHQATFIKRTLFDSIGLYDTRNHINSDWAFFILAICKFNVRYRHIPCVFSLFQKGGVTGTMSKLERIKSQEKFLEEHFGMYYRDMLDYVLLRQKSFKSRGYKFLAAVASFVLKNYFSLGGKPLKFLENIKPGYKESPKAV